MGCGHAADRFAVGLLVRNRLQGRFEGAGSYIAQIGRAARRSPRLALGVAGAGGYRPRRELRISQTNAAQSLLVRRRGSERLRTKKV